MSAGLSTRPKTLLKDTAYERLRDLILDGTLAPGQFLAERRLAEVLGMSKTPIRSALERLEAQGLVTVSPQQGIMIRELSPREAYDSFDTRFALEPYVVRSLALRARPEQLSLLRDNLAQQAELAREERSLDFTRLDVEFHLLLCDFHDNREISRVMTQLLDKLYREVVRISRQEPGRFQDSYAEHLAIYRAIEAGQADTAAERMTEHLKYARRVLSQQ